jgi:hypothetical protein
MRHGALETSVRDPTGGVGGEAAFEDDRDDHEQGDVDGVGEVGVADDSQYPQGFGAFASGTCASHLAGMAMTLIVTEWLRRVPDFEVESGYTRPRNRLQPVVPRIRLANAAAILG